MAIIKSHWWDKIYIEFYLDIYILTIETRLFVTAVERLSYDICRVRVSSFRKKLFEFQLYKRPR